MNKISLYWLYTGFLLFVFGYFFTTSSNDLELSLRAEILGILPVYFILLFSILLAPILEEVCFRSLLVTKEISLTKKLSSSILFISFFIIIQKVNVIPLVTLTLMIYFFGKRKINSNLYTFLMIILTSICFSLAHLQVFAWSNIYTFCMYFGLGICFAFIANNYSIRKAIIGHSFYNLLVSIPILFILFKSVIFTPIKWDNNQFRGEINMVSHNIELGSSSYRLKDSIIIKNRSLNQVIFDLNDCTNCLKVREGSIFSKVNLSIYSKKPYSINASIILDSLLSTSMASLDKKEISNEEHYIIEEKEKCNKEFKNIIPDFYSKLFYNSDYLGEYIYKKYRIVAIVGNKNIKRAYKLDANVFDYSFKEFKKYLEDEYCIILTPSNKTYTKYTIK